MPSSAVSAFLSALAAHKADVLQRSVAEEFAADPQRFSKHSVTFDDLLFDFSKQRVNATTMALLKSLAEAAGVEAKRDAMFRGDIINTTEKRAVLHTALRDLTCAPILVDGKDVAPDVVETREKMLGFAADVREGRVRGALGQPMTDVVNIGIGGSDLGPAFAARALAALVIVSCVVKVFDETMNSVRERSSGSSASERSAPSTLATKCVRGPAPR